MTAVSGEVRLRWMGVKRLFTPSSEPTQLLAMDSFLVHNCQVRALHRHIQRFAAACSKQANIAEHITEDFVLAAVRKIPSNGSWFPRLELVLTKERPELELLIRPAPPRGQSVRLWVSPTADQRCLPTIKGVDLPLLTALRTAAISAGADEAVLLSCQGHILEGSTTSLLWWRDNMLCGPPPEAPLLPSVTRAEILELAADRGIQFYPELIRPEQVQGCEVWAVNALHGIRPVTLWLNAAVTAGSSVRADEWQRALMLRSESLC